MPTKNFITSIKSSLAFKDLKKESKKDSLKDLLHKLNAKKIYITRSMETSLEQTEKKAFQEDLDIISLHIQKGEKLLNSLSLKT